MDKIISLAVLNLLTTICTAQNITRLQVHPDQRHLIYQNGSPFFYLDLGTLKGSGLILSWFHPRMGTWIKGGSLPITPTMSFDPPGDEAAGNDWLLLLDAES